MPFKSLAQEGYLHAHPDILGKSGLKEWDAATKGKHLPEHTMKDKRGHHFSHSTVHHHKDGSHHTEHHHESDPAKNVSYAKEDTEGMMGGMEQNLGGQAEEPAAAPAAAPPGGAPAGM